MIKYLQKYLLTTATILSVALTVNAQVVEDFTTFTQAGYSAFTGCETTTIAAGTFNVTKTYAGPVSVTYTFLNASVDPTCNIKGGASTSCTALNEPGYAQLSNTTGALGVLTTSSISSVAAVDFIYSSTGANRGGVLEKSTDGGANWTNVLTFTDPCSQYGVSKTGVGIGSTNVMLRFTTDPVNIQRLRIHKLSIYLGLGVQNASWLESGVAVAVDNNYLTLISDNVSGSVEIIGLTGGIVAQKEIQKGDQASFVMPVNGLYTIRFISSENKVYTKKISVN